MDTPDSWEEIVVEDESVLAEHLLPTEIWFQIFTHINWCKLLQINTLCKLWHEIIDDESLFINCYHIKIANSWYNTAKFLTWSNKSADVYYDDYNADVGWFNEGDIMRVKNNHLNYRIKLNGEWKKQTIRGKRGVYRILITLDDGLFTKYPIMYWNSFVFFDLGKEIKEQIINNYSTTGIVETIDLIDVRYRHSWFIVDQIQYTVLFSDRRHYSLFSRDITNYTREYMDTLLVRPIRDGDMELFNIFDKSVADKYTTLIAYNI